MAINTKAVKGRINSVKNTKKITKAMEMIAAVKMRKAVQVAVSTREYSKMAYDLIENLGAVEKTNPLLGNENEVAEDAKHLLIIISSNRGLCGNYNSRILKEVGNFLEQEKLKNFDVIAVGTKSAKYAKKRGLTVIEYYDKLSDKPRFEDILPISRSIQRSFVDGTYKSVNIFFTNYISGLSQIPENRKVLPIKQEVLKKIIEETGRDEDLVMQEEVRTDEYAFEPDRTEVLDQLLPMLVDIQIYQAILESTASEHSSRMIAMKNASESANDMIYSLTLEFNKGRQAAITQEVSEIVNGAESI